MSSRGVAATIIDDEPAAYEERHVHAIYDQIAGHFSSTRYKPWPIIAKFLADLPTGWVGLDSGTGNGKYLPLPSDRPGDIWTIGMDRSRNLLQIAQSAGGQAREVVWGDVLGSNWRIGAFDYAISIATIHHLATTERRKLAVQKLLGAVSPSHGRILIYVWAIEQDSLSKRQLPVTDCTDNGVDVVVPWVLNNSDSQVFNRYYHMFAKGELRNLVVNAAQDLGLSMGQPENARPEESRGVEIVQDGWERSNYYVELRLWEVPPNIQR